MKSSRNLSLEPSPPTPPRRLDAYTRWCIVALSVCLTTLLLYGCVILSLKSRISEELALIQHEGYPIAIAPPAPAPTTWPADDAEPDMEAAGRDVSMGTYDSDAYYALGIASKEFDDTGKTFLNPPRIKLRAEALARLKPYFEDLKRAGEKPFFRRIASYSGGLGSPYYIRARASEAADQKNAADYVEMIDDLFYLASLQGRKGIVSSPYDRREFLVQGVKMLKYGLVRLSFAKAQLAKLSARLDHFDHDIDPVRKTAFQRAFKIYSFDLEACESYIPREFRDLRWAITGLTYQYSGALLADELLMLRRMRQEMKIAALPAMERRKAADLYGLEDDHVVTFDSGVRCQGLYLRSWIQAVDDGERWLLVAKAILAIERYRLDHADRMPKTLDELVPEYLPSALIDPSTQKPLDYIPGPKGYGLRVVDRVPVTGPGLSDPDPQIAVQVDFPDVSP